MASQKCKVAQKWPLRKLIQRQGKRATHCRNFAQQDHGSNEKLIVQRKSSSTNYCSTSPCRVNLLRSEPLHNNNRQNSTKTRMRGKAQPDGRPAVELIETPVLLRLSAVVDQSTRALYSKLKPVLAPPCLNPALVTSANNN